MTKKDLANYRRATFKDARQGDEFSVSALARVYAARIWPKAELDTLNQDLDKETHGTFSNISDN